MVGPLKYTTRTETFFYAYITITSLFMVIAINPQYDYGFMMGWRFWLFAATMFASPIQYWHIWNYPQQVMEAGKMCGMHGVEFTHTVVGYIKMAENISYILLINGGRWNDFFAGTYEMRRFDTLAWICLWAGQALNLSVYHVLGVNGVNYGSQMDEKRAIPWIHGFPFNTGTRHPQYIGCVLGWVSVMTLYTPAEQFGKLIIACWCVVISYWYSGELEVEVPPDMAESLASPTKNEAVVKRT